MIYYWHFLFDQNRNTIIHMIEKDDHDYDGYEREEIRTSDKKTHVFLLFLNSEGKSIPSLNELFKGMLQELVIKRERREKMIDHLVSNDSLDEK